MQQQGMMPSSTIHVLLVEDDAMDAQAVQRAFDRVKITNEITVASDGLEALQILRGENGYKRLHRPYIILLDINMGVFAYPPEKVYSRVGRPIVESKRRTVSR